MPTNNVANSWSKAHADSWNHTFGTDQPDYRRTETAWAMHGWGHDLFLLGYIILWVIVIVAFHFRDFLSKQFAELKKKFQRQAEDDEEVDIETLCRGPQPSYPSGKRVFELIDQFAQSTKTALVIPESGSQPRKEISYAQFVAVIEEVAANLNNVGVTQGSTVALVMDRSVAQVAAVWGTLRGGAAFLPVDHLAPDWRKELVIRESGAPVVIVAQSDALGIAFATSMGLTCLSVPEDGNPGVQVHGPVTSQPVQRRLPGADDMALLIYTSGTTGTPKGIVYTHTHLLHGAWFFGEQCDVNAETRALLRSPYFWAVIEWEMFPALTRGGQLVIAPAEGHKSPEFMAKVIQKEKIDVFMITPSVLDLILDAHQAQDSAALSPLKHIISVGEPLPTAVANRTMKTRGVFAALHNFYGASESSCTIFTLRPKEFVDEGLYPRKAPAGTPQPYCNIFVMNRALIPEEGDIAEHLELVGPGETGEIFFGGVMAGGYFQRDELTNQKFIQTANFGRLYRSGDLGKWTKGLLEVVGRADRQVKIRGVRIEPGEIEMVLKKFTRTLGEDDGSGSAIADAAVVASPEPSELVAYVQLREGVVGVGEDHLRAHVASQLTPSYVPKFIVVLPDGLPRLPNGKPNMGELQQRAGELVEAEGEMVMDSLGQMKKMSRWAVVEQDIINRCYAYWMLGVIVDHYDLCGWWEKDECAVEAKTYVPAWTELLVRSVGGYQDMYGYIMLGAYQDSRPIRENGPSQVNLGFKDFWMFIIYLMMALPIPQILHLIFGPLAYPVIGQTLEKYPPNLWGADYMAMNKNLSVHRWYLLMVIEARIFLWAGEKLKVHPIIQLSVLFIPYILFDFYGLDPCHEGTPEFFKYIFQWVFGSYDGSCPAYNQLYMVYLILYVACFHYLRRFVNAMGQKSTGRNLTSPTFNVAALAASMLMPVAMPIMGFWGWKPTRLGNVMGVDLIQLIQPSLFAIGMKEMTIDLGFWGRTTLGAYVFHFYFIDHMQLLLNWYAKTFSHVVQPIGGVFLLVAIVGTCFLMQTVCGYFGNIILTAPYTVGPCIKKLRQKASRFKSKKKANVEEKLLESEQREMERVHFDRAGSGGLAWDVASLRFGDEEIESDGEEFVDGTDEDVSTEESSSNEHP